MHNKFSSLIIPLLFIFSSCTIYKSADRKDFESTYSFLQFTELNRNLCSNTSISEFASAANLIGINENQSDGESLFTWEYKIGNETYIETNNLKGTYCAHKKNN